MTLSDIQNSLLNPVSSVDHEFSNAPKTKIRTPILTQFIQSSRNDTLFNLFFILLILGECLLFIFFLTVLIQSAILAINLAIIFASGFTYFILRLHRQAQKPAIILEICDRFEEEFSRHSEFEPGYPEYHIALAHGYARMAGTLNGKESRYYPLPNFLNFLKPKVMKISQWVHWYDVYKMKEALLLRSVDEYTKLVKLEPTNLEIHAALANAYVMLSGLHHPPKKTDDSIWSISNEMIQILQEKFTWASQRAIEEFKILNEYAPNDPWVHQQLAYSYHDLQMPLEEIREYEILLTLLPHDDEILYKLGTLYFQQGENAKGLAIYETLRERDNGKAEALIQHYGERP